MSLRWHLPLRLTTVLAILGILVGMARAGESSQAVQVHVFWRAGCPHCARALDFLKPWDTGGDRIRVLAHEIGTDAGNRDAFRETLRRVGIERPVVPLILVGDAVFQGFNDAATTGAEIRAAVEACLVTSCPDRVQPLLTGGRATVDPVGPAARPPRTLRLPLFGEVNPAQVSLPALTIMLGAVDGFNPCAMWALVFLISLLVGLRDRFRMWVLGASFILASAVVYYLFMAAWLNLLLFLGMLAWIRRLVGVLALAGGGYYLHEYFRHPDAICRVTAPASRRRVFARLRALAGERSFLLALAGIVLLAFAVNLVELICSAGIPAVYTQVLALSRLQPWQYHAYLSLYILIFMLDDLVVFVVAMHTLRVTGLTGAYVRHAHAIGGVVLVTIGLLLLFKPEWLAFSI